MSYSIFILSLIGLCIAAIAAFIGAFRAKSRLLVIFVPLIGLCGSLIYFSYVSVLGFPVKMEWEQLPDKITVIYFRVDGTESITLWLFEGGTTRLIELPYIEPAENSLEGERGMMGTGVPVTFERGSGQGGAHGKGGKGKGKGKGGKGGAGNGKDSGEEEGEGHGWRYKVRSYGIPIDGGSMTPKPYSE